MTSLCCGTTAKQNSCTNKVTSPNKYCRYHKDQQYQLTDPPKIIKPIPIPNINNKSNYQSTDVNKPFIQISESNISIPKISDTSKVTYELSKTLPKLNDCLIQTPRIEVKNQTKEIKVECTICLDDIDELDDVGLICNHKCCNACMKQFLKPECPTCKGPLIFNKKNNINVEEIKIREQKDIVKTKEQTITKDEEFARELEREERRRNRRNRDNGNNGLIDEFMLAMLMEQQLMMNEEREFNLAIENSLRI